MGDPIPTPEPEPTPPLPDDPPIPHPEPGPVPVPPLRLGPPIKWPDEICRSSINGVSDLALCAFDQELSKAVRRSSQNGKCANGLAGTFT
jgi:hypothetical protein